MPVGGRINRRDNLRSKKALTKCKADKDVKSKPAKENAPVLRNLENMKRNNVEASVKKEVKADNDVFVTTDKSELIVRTIRSFYIYLEDINKTESVDYNKSAKEDKISNLEDHTLSINETLDASKLKSIIPKRKTKNFRNYQTEECELIIEDIMEGDVKNIKNVVQHDKNDSEQTDETNKLQKSVKIDASKITEKPEGIKRKGRQRTLQTAVVQEDVNNDVKILEAISHENDFEKSDHVKGKNRTQKKIETILPLVNQTAEKLSPIKLVEKKSNQTDETLKSAETKDPVKELTRMPSRLGRKNISQKDKEEKTELIKESIDQIERDQATNAKRKTAARSTRKQIDYSDNKETESSEIAAPVSVIDSVDLDADIKDAMETDQPQEAPVNVLQPETRKAGRPFKSRVPFVIEKMVKDQQETVSQSIKIPGLMMLEKIRNRKSCALQPLVTTETEVKPDPKIDVKKEISEKQTRGKTNEKKTTPIKQTNTKLSTEKSKPKISDIVEGQDFVEKKITITKHSEKKSTLSDVTVPEPIPVVPEPMETEDFVSETKKIDTPMPKKCRRSEVQTARKSVCKPELSDSAPTKIPGLRMIEDIRRRKSQMQTTLMPAPVAVSAAARRSSARQPIMPSYAPTETPQSAEPLVTSTDSKEVEKVPGLDTITELKSYSRNSIHSLRTPDISIATKRPRTAAATNCADTSVIMDTKVPGLSATNQLRKQKIAQQNTVVSTEITKPSVISKTIERPVVSTPITKSKVPTPSIQVGRSTPVGILCKPSPYKRPISCIADESGDNENDFYGNSGAGESRRKMARVQTEKRQSVTFNREVEVKEIHGNSFNSITDDTEQADQQHRFNFGSSKEDVPTDQLAREEFQRKLETELERTKNFLKDRRFQNCLSGGRVRETAAVQQIAMLSNPVKPLAKKCSDLSNLISQRAKLTSLSPPRVPLSSVARSTGSTGLTGSVVSSISASKKVSNVSNRNETASRNLDQWKSFRNPVGIPDVEDDHNRTCDDDESMSCSDDSVQPNKKEGGACTIM